MKSHLFTQERFHLWHVQPGTHTAVPGDSTGKPSCVRLPACICKETVQRVQTDLQVSYVFPNHNSKYSDNYPWLDKYSCRHNKPVRLACSVSNHQFHVCLGHLHSHFSLKHSETHTDTSPLCQGQKLWLFAIEVDQKSPTLNMSSPLSGRLHLDLVIHSCQS